MRFEILIAFFGFLLYVAAYILASIKRFEGNRGVRLSSYILLPFGILLYAVFGAIWMAETYATDKTYLAILAIIFSSLAFLLLPVYSLGKEKFKTLSSLALAGAFLFGIAFLVSMIALSQDAILNGLDPEQSSSLLLSPLL